MRADRLRAAGIVAGYVVLVVVVLVARGRSVADAAILGPVLVVVGMAGGWAAERLATRARAQGRDRGTLRVRVRRQATEPGRWIQAEVVPVPGELRVRPLGGPSAVPTTVPVSQVGASASTARWRDRALALGPVAELRIEGADGAWQVQCPSDSVGWLTTRLTGCEERAERDDRLGGQR
ncbi:MAG TPA: hypothetical protein VGC57_16425 [Cellulomonas sp.]